VATDVEITRLVSKREAARILGCSVRSVDRLRERGRLPAIQFSPGSRVRFRVRDVAVLLEPEAREPHPVRADELEWR
jgi:excisionase family DNA binding protein